MRDEIWAVIDRYRRASGDQEPRDAERVWVNVHVLPDVDIAEREEG